MHWLLTRPEGQNAALAQQLQRLGHQVSVMPVLLIQPLLAPDQATLWSRLSEFVGLLFTSINAVEQFAAGLQLRGLAWPTVAYFAIGLTTQDALMKQGQWALSPAQDFDSESLLALPELAALAGRSVLLVTGAGGRGLLQPALTAKGIKVERLDVYARVCNPRFVWPADKVDGLLVTSLESWHCLLDKNSSELCDCVVVAGSPRIAKEVAAVARQTLVAASPRDQDMLAALQERFR